MSCQPGEDSDLVELLTFFTHIMTKFGPDIPLCLPVIPKTVMIKLLMSVKKIFQEEDSLLKIASNNITIIGDLHGNLLDLFRIIKRQGLHGSTTYLFLGDLVDRGQFSLEVCVFIFLMKCFWPTHVLIIRGNHEFKGVTQRCGFASEISEIYKDSLVENTFYDTFAWIPLGAIVNDEIFCVHGGLGPCLTNTDQIHAIKRPVYECNTDLLVSMLWSDPCDECITFSTSKRGIGYKYGEMVTKDFLRRENLKCIIRGHECVETGYKEHFGGLVLTIFSASNYCEILPNKGGILLIKDGVRTPVCYSSVGSDIKRNQVMWLHSKSEEHFTIKVTEPEDCALPALKRQGTSQKHVLPDVSRSISRIVRRSVQPGALRSPHILTRPRSNSITNL